MPNLLFKLTAGGICGTVFFCQGVPSSPTPPTPGHPSSGIQISTSEKENPQLLNTSPGNPAIEKAESILRKSLDAYGGEDKILGIKDASYAYKVQMVDDTENESVLTRSFFKGETQFKSLVEQKNQSAITVLNEEEAWAFVGGTKIPLAKNSVSAMKNNLVIQVRPDLLLLCFPKHRYTIRTEQNQRSLDLIEVSGFLGGEYLRGRIAIDAATQLIYRFEYELEREFPQGKGIANGEEQYLSYQLIQGLQVPVEIISKQGQKRSRLTLQSARFNTPLDDSVFAEPSGK
jgi:hypothetical protein